MTKQLRMICLAAWILLSGSLHAQTGMSNVVFLTGTDSTRWLPLSAAAEAITFTAVYNDADCMVDIGFNFYMGERTLRQLSMNANGAIRLGDTPMDRDLNDLFGEIHTHYPFVSAYAYDTRMDVDTANSYALYEQLGTAPNRVLVIEVETPPVRNDYSGATLRYQVQLHENGNKVVLVYGDNTVTGTVYFRCGIGIDPDNRIAIHTDTHTDSLVGNSYLYHNNTLPPAGRYYELQLPIPACPQPLPSGNIVTTTSGATLHWSAQADSYLLEYADSLFVPATGSATVVANIPDTTVTLTHLRPATRYHYALRAICGNDNSIHTLGEFVTDCLPTTLPYRYGFEAEDTLSLCWTLWQEGHYEEPDTIHADAHTDSSALLLPIAGHRQAFSCAALPSATEGLGGTSLSFYCRKRATDSYNGTMLHIGYYRHAGDADSFVSLTTVALDHTDWRLYTAAFPDTIDYPDGARAGFRIAGTSLGYISYCLIDDVLWYTTPTCPHTRDLTATTGTTYALFTWNYEATAGQQTPTGYTLSYAPLDSLNNRTDIDLDTRYAILGPLEPDTRYRAWVVPHCDEEHHGDSDSLTFHTQRPECRGYSRNDTMQIGYDSQRTNEYPISTANHFTYRQMIYHAADLGDSTFVVNKIAWQYNDYNSNDTLVLTDAELYLAHAPDSLIDLSNGFVPFDSTRFRLVKRGLRIGGHGWTEYELDSTFAYNGRSPLLVAIKAHIPERDLSYSFVHSSRTDACRAIGNDSTAIDLATLDTTAGTASHKLPNIRFFDIVCDSFAPCAAPLVDIDSIGSNYAHLTWAPGSHESHWDVLYKAGSSHMWIPLELGTSYQETTLTALQPGTRYDVRVIGHCDDSLYTDLSFATHCSTLTRHDLPYFENFASTPRNAIPPCWVAYDNDATIGLPTVLGNDQLHYLRFAIFENYDATYNLAALPAIAVPLDSLILSLELYTLASEVGWTTPIPYSGTLIVGAMSDPYDLATFEPIDTLVQAATETWQEFSVDLSHYSGDAHHIALYQDIAFQEANTIRFDDIRVTNIHVSYNNHCQQLTGAYATRLTPYSADIMLQDADNSGTSRYAIYYGLLDERAYATDSVVLDTPFGTLNNLSPSTTYYGWAEALCDSTSRSRPRTFHFTTPPVCGEVENLTAQYSYGNHSALLSWEAPTTGNDATAYIVNFSSNNHAIRITDTTTLHYYHIQGLQPDSTYLYQVTTLCNSYASSTHSGILSTMAHCSSIEVGDTLQANVPFYTNCDYTYAQSLYTSYDLAAMGDTIHGIYLHNVNASANCTVYVDVYLGNSIRTQFANAYDWVPLGDLTRMASNYCLVIQGSGWVYIPFATPFVRHSNQNLVVAIDNNTGNYVNTNRSPQWSSTRTNTLRSIFTLDYEYNISPSNPNTTYAAYGMTAVPDIRFDAPCLSDNCATPLLLSTAQSTTGISLQWFAGGTETTWDLDYRRTGDTAWIPVLTNTGDSSTTINSLQSGCNYEVRISCICDGNRYSTTQQYTTLCAPLSLPYTETFSQQSLGIFASNCWESSGTQSNRPTVLLDNDEHVLDLANGAYLAAPDFIVATDSMQLHLDYKGTRAGDFVYVGILTHHTSIQSFIPFDTLVVHHPYAWHSATVRFDDSMVPDGNICLYMPYGHPLGESFVVDNLIFEYNSYCPDVDSVWTIAVDSNSASVAWHSDYNNHATGYLVEYGPAGFVRGNGTTLRTTNTSTSLGGLLCATMYDLYVTPLCSSGDTMYTASLLRFATECGTVPVPYSMNFDLPYIGNQTQTGAMPLCWHYGLFSSSTEGLPQIVTSSGYESSGTQALHLYQKAVVALPAMAAPMDTLQVSFFAYTHYYNGHTLLEIGTVDSVTPGFEASFVPFDTVLCHYGIRDTIILCGATGKHIAFMNSTRNNSGSTAFFEVYLDDVTVDYRPACLPVQYIVRDSNDVSSISLHWSSCGTVAEYEIEYGAPSFTPGYGEGRLTSTTPAITITGLSTATQYEIYVRSHCSEGNYGPWNKAMFSTAACNGPGDIYFFYDTSSNNTTAYIPGNSYFAYSYTQLILDSAMMAESGFVAGSSVAGFSFYPTSADGGDVFDNCRVLMTNSNAVNYTRYKGFVQLDSLDVTYQGTLGWTEAGWRDVEFQTPFVWDGHSNVVLAVDRDHGHWGSRASFRSTRVNSTRAIYMHSDSYNPDPYDAMTVNRRDQFTPANMVPQIRLRGCEGVPCTITQTEWGRTDHSATLMWSSHATTFEVNVKPTESHDWPDNILLYNTYTHTFAHLQPGTEYHYRLRALCDDGTISPWTVGSFVTDTLPQQRPLQLTAVPSFGTAEMSWTVNGEENEWYIRVWNHNYDRTLRVQSNPATFDSLTPATDYYATVCAILNDNALLSDWSDTIRFSTKTCDPVSDVAAMVEGNMATVTWRPGENNNGNFMVEYGYEGFALGQGIERITVTNNGIILYNLEDNTRYEVAVRALCEGQYPSTWSGTTLFEVSIPTAEVTGVQVSLYPNPAKEHTTLNVSGLDGEITVTLADLHGRTIHRTTLTCHSHCDKQLQLQKLPAGIYFVRLHGHGTNIVKKLTIQ